MIKRKACTPYEVHTICFSLFSLWTNFTLLVHTYTKCIRTICFSLFTLLTNFTLLVDTFYACFVILNFSFCNYYLFIPFRLRELNQILLYAQNYNYWLSLIRFPILSCKHIDWSCIVMTNERGPNYAFCVKC